MILAILASLVFKISALVSNQDHQMHYKQIKMLYQLQSQYKRWPTSVLDQIDQINQSISVRFQNNETPYEAELTQQQTSEKPFLQFQKQPGKQYTIIMVDPDAPSSQNPVNKYWLHWLVTNNKDTIVQYNGPQPPTGSGIHRYFICIFQQNENEELKLTQKIGRPKFNIESFVHQNNLGQIGCFKFIVRG